MGTGMEHPPKGTEKAVGKVMVMGTEVTCTAY